MKKIYFIYIICILFSILSFCKDLVVPVPGMGRFIQASFILCLFLFMYFCIFYNNLFVKDLKQVLFRKRSSFRIYIYLILYILTQTLIYGFCGKINMAASLTEVFSQYFIVILMTFIVIIFMTNRILKLSLVIKCVYSIIYGILLLGIVDFIAYNAHISFLQTLVNLPNNSSTLVYGQDVFVKSMSYGLYRVQSIFFEPGYLGEHIFIFLPIIYILANLKMPIYKTKRINTLVQKTIIPLTWINIILTQSPLWLCMSIILTVIMYYKYILKKFIIILLFIITVGTIFMTIDIQETYLSRITRVIVNASDINLLIEENSSLGTRLSCILNLIDIGLTSPITGIGHSNIKPRIIEQIQYNKSKVFVTQEMYHCILYKAQPTFQNPMLVNFFVRYGLIALCLLLYLIYKLRRNLNILSRNYPKLLYSNFAQAISISIICILIVGCYDTGLGNTICQFFIGLGFGMEQYLLTKRYINCKMKGKLDER